MGTQRHGQGILEPPIATADEHARLIEAERERIEAVEATVQLKQRRTKLPR